MRTDLSGLYKVRWFTTMTCYMTDPDGRTSHKKQNRNCDYSQNL